MGNDVADHQHAPTRLKAATGSTYCKAIVANRKLPDQGAKPLGQRLGRERNNTATED